MEHMVWCRSGELVSESDDNLTSRPAYIGQRIVLLNPSKSKTIRQKTIQVDPDLGLTNVEASTPFLERLLAHYGSGE